MYSDDHYRVRPLSTVRPRGEVFGRTTQVKLLIGDWTLPSASTAKTPPPVPEDPPLASSLVAARKFEAIRRLPERLLALRLRTCTRSTLPAKTIYRSAARPDFEWAIRWFPTQRGLRSQTSHHYCRRAQCGN